MFDQCTLFVSSRSPFARRVRLAFLENSIPFELKTVEVWKPSVSELTEINPLSRVPTVRLKSGEILVDSTVILNLFYGSPASSESSSKWRINRPKSLQEAIQTDFWSAMAVGLMDHVINYYVDSLRPPEVRDIEVMQEAERTFERVLSRMEQAIEVGELGKTSAPLHQCDLDLGAALGYMCFRYSEKWKSQYPKSAGFFRSLDERNSFQQTRPE